MRHSTLAAVGLTAVVAAGCGPTATPVADGCTDEGQVVERALRSAPGTVRLPDGSRLSQCIGSGTGEADLLDVGMTFTRAADGLRVRAREEQDQAAAVQLGYLVGATRKGAAETNGVMAELQRRVELVGGRLQDEAPSLAPAVQKGLVAGERRG